MSEQAIIAGASSFPGGRAGHPRRRAKPLPHPRQLVIQEEDEELCGVGSGGVPDAAPSQGGERRPAVARALPLWQRAPAALACCVLWSRSTQQRPAGDDGVAAAGHRGGNEAPPEEATGEELAPATGHGAGYACA